MFPTPGGTVDTLTPTLYANYFYTDATQRWFAYQVCGGSPGAPVGCHNTGWTTSSTYQVPPGWITSWGTPWYWQVQISEGYAYTNWLTPFTFTTQVPQLGVTGHLAGAPEGSEMPGVNPQPGNYATSVTDAVVHVAGPALSTTRVYNSQDLRTTGAFGRGWSTPWDQKVVLEPDNTGNAVVTLPTGLVTRFGGNSDGSFTAPLGQNMTLVYTTASSSWTLRDPSGTLRTYATNVGAGTWRLSTVTDADGRTQTYTYDVNGHLGTVTDVVSTRALHVTWTGTTAGDHIASVATDAPGSGQPTPTWTYSYTGVNLTGVCTPLGAASCTTYTYATSSHYRSTILDDNPVGYWPLDETSGTSAANLAARTPGSLDATYSGVQLNQPGALTGSPDAGVTGSSANTAAVVLPSNLFATTLSQALEIWFKASSGQGGVLFSEQNTPLSSPASSFTPVMYVGTDGKLRGQFWTTAGANNEITSPGTVTNGTWHHTVLSGNGDHQELYLDGVLLGSFTGHTIAHAGSYTAIGNGMTWTGAFPFGMANGNYPFTGQLDEAAYYSHPLDLAQVSAHYAARAPSTRMSTVVEPGSFTAMSATYDSATGRVASMVDRNGATWTLGAPSIQADGRHVTLSSNANSPANQITYLYDPYHNGRLVSRTDTLSVMPKTWQYGPAGFVASVTDENGNVTSYLTDAHGNVTQTTTCRVPGSPATDCHSSYAHYFLDTSHPLDPRNDVQDWTSDARSTDGADTTFRTTRVLDAAGRVTQVTYPKPAGQSTNPTETFAYTDGVTGPPAGLLASHTARNGAVTTYTHNGFGDLVSTLDPVGLLTTNTLDPLGRVASVHVTSDVGGVHADYGTSTITYTSLSEPWVMTGPAIVNPVTGVTHQGVLTLGYDNAGRETSGATSDGVGGDTTRTTTWGYDPAGRMASTTNPDGTVTTQGWNTAGDLTTTTLPSGLSTTMTYDAHHRLLTTTATGAGVDPQAPTATTLQIDQRSYDPAGRLTASVDAMQQLTTSYRYYGDNLRNTTTATHLPSPKPDVVLEQDSYDPAGHLTSQTAAGTYLPVITTTTYDPAGNVATRTVDPTGLNRVTTTSYNLDNTPNHATTTGAASPGRVERVDYTYDAAGRVLTTTMDNTGSSPSALTTTLVRDPRGLVTRSIDATNIATDTSYDLAGQPVTTTGAARTIWVADTSTSGVAPVTTIGRNTFGDPTQQRDPNGNTTTTTGYDTMSRPTSVTLPGYTPPGGIPITATTTTTYNQLGKPLTVTDPAGHLTTYTYDKYGRTLTRTQPDPDGAGPKTSPVWAYTYDRDGELLDTLDPAGEHVQTTYDERGRPATTTRTDHVGSTQMSYISTIGYDDAGHQTVSTPLPNTTTTTTFNPAGEPIKVTDPTGVFTQTSYDLAGRVVATVHGQGSTYANPVTTTSYDLAGRATVTTDCTTTTAGACNAVLRSTPTIYDAAGRRTQTTTAFGRPTFYGYDSAGQLTSITQRVDPTNPATAITVSLGYGPVGNKTRMVDGNLNATTYIYNTWNLPESTIEPATTAHPNAADRTWTTSYNNLRQSTTDILPGGVARTRSYDNLGRLTTETGTGAEATTTTRTLDYDPLGRITSATSPAGSLTYTYTDRGQLATATGYGGTTTYTYDANQHLTNRTDPTGAATFGYDTAGRLTTVVDPLTSTTATTTFDTLGRPANVSYGTGKPSRTYTYDTLGRIATDTTTTTTTGGATTASIVYGYDTDNLLTSKTTTGLSGAGANTYTYDGLSRVTSWLNPAGTTAGYGYDNASNRTTVTTPTGTRTSTYDQRNRISATTGASQPADTYTFNARGELLAATKAGQNLTYTFDGFDRLTQVQKTAGYTVAFTYDSLDRAAQRNTANFGYHDLTNNPVTSPAAAGETSILRNPLGAALSSKIATGTGTLLLGDTRHTDINANLDPTTGTPGPSTDYDPWGAPTATPNPTPLGFQGGYTDPQTGLVNAHARWYDPTLGTFTSRDTLTLPPNPVAQTNRYLYANNSPPNGQDPSGHEAGSWCTDSSCALLNAQFQTSHPMETGFVNGVAQTKKAPKISADEYTQAYLAVHRDPLECRVYYYNGPCTPITDLGVKVYGASKQLYIAATAADLGYVPTLLCRACDAQIKQTDQALEKLKQTFLGMGITDFVDCMHKNWVGCAGLVVDIVMFVPGIGEAAEFVKALKAAEDTAKGIKDVSEGEKVAQSVADTGAVRDIEDGADGAVKPSCSFSADTRVLVTNGTATLIRDLRPGQTVLATDPLTGHTASKPVTETHIHTDTDLADVTVRTDGRDDTVIHTTQNHPFWDSTRHDWVPAAELQPGDTLYADTDHTATVTKVLTFTAQQSMYNLTIADTHTYYVVAGTRPVLVHNCPEDEIPSGGTNSRDIHGADRTVLRGVDVDHVWQNGEMYIQNDGQVVKVLDNGNGTFDIVVRDMSNPSGAPTTAIKAASSNYVENQINSGRWQ